MNYEILKCIIYIANKQKCYYKYTQEYKISLIIFLYKNRNSIKDQ